MNSCPGDRNWGQRGEGGRGFCSAEEGVGIRGVSYLAVPLTPGVAGTLLPRVSGPSQRPKGPVASWAHVSLHACWFPRLGSCVASGDCRRSGPRCPRQRRGIAVQNAEGMLGTGPGARRCGTCVRRCCCCCWSCFYHSGFLARRSMGDQEETGLWARGVSLPGAPSVSLPLTPLGQASGWLDHQDCGE